MHDCLGFGETIIYVETMYILNNNIIVLITIVMRIEFSENFEFNSTKRNRFCVGGELLILRGAIDYTSSIHLPACVKLGIVILTFILTL